MEKSFTGNEEEQVDWQSEFLIDAYDKALRECEQEYKALRNLFDKVSLERDEAVAAKEEAHEALRKAEQNELKALADLDEAFSIVKELCYYDDIINPDYSFDRLVDRAKKFVKDFLGYCYEKQ